MQLQLHESMTQHQLKRLRHVSLPGKLPADVITDIRTLKPTAHNLTQCNHSYYSPIINAADHESSSSRRCVSFHVGVELDRKSTRLNSSHLVISYAVFCLKKKI